MTSPARHPNYDLITIIFNSDVPRIITDETKSGTAYVKVEETAPSSDYIVLPNQSFPPAPKSARPSRGRQDDPPEEIIIVGAKNLLPSPIFGIDPTPNLHHTPNNFLMNTNDRSPNNTEKTNQDIAMYIKESKTPTPNAFATTGRLPSKGKDNHTNEDFPRNRAHTDVKNSSWESSTGDQDDSIYNHLRSKQNDDSYNDYQRLLRQSQIQQNSDAEEGAYDVTSTHTFGGGAPGSNGIVGHAKITQNAGATDELYLDVAPTNGTNGGYVKTFHDK